MNAEAAILSEEDFDRFRNTSLVQVVIPSVLRRILEKATANKSPSETYWSYFSNTLKITRNDLTGKKYGVSAVAFKHVQQCSDASTFDCSLLFALIEAVDNTSDVSRKQPKELKSAIKDAKDIRNKISHSVDAEGSNSAHYMNTKKTLHELIQKCGCAYNLSKTTIDNELQELQRKFDDIDICRRKDVIQVKTSFFIENGKKEMTHLWANDCNFATIPFSDEQVSGNFYTPSKIRSESQSCGSDEESALLTSSAGLSILCGEAGSGKSTLLRNIARHFLGLSNESPSLLASVSTIDMLYFLECRETTYKNLEEYVQGSFPGVTKILGHKNMSEVFFHVQKSLLLIDGFDEINQLSNVVLHELIDKTKAAGKAFKIIVATRTHSREQVKRLASEKGIKYEIFNMLDVDEKLQQLAFLEKYETALSLSSSEIRVKFSNLPAVVASYLRTPVTLAWFCYLIQSGLVNVDEWRNIADVTSQIYKYYAKSVENRLLHKVPVDLDIIVQEVLDVIALFAFRSLAIDTLLVTDREMMTLKKMCLKVFRTYQVPADISVMNVLSCVLSTKRLPSGEVIHHFIHKSHQEAFAAEALLNKLEMYPSMSVKVAVSELSKNDDLHIFQK